ncbi:MAG: ATP-binding protein [Leptospiraceae bacterium]|nr:ATP-binding protein [Leptospiraceae bacterium]MCP5494574.1 ATP-binding protein [Leptospiraceae bacterium]
MKKLGIGIQSFPKLLNENCVYVDKTEHIYELITQGSNYFFSRPRRFGKSLLVSTLSEIFSGNKELFQEFWIYDKIDWKAYPLIHIDFSALDYKEQTLEDTLHKRLKKIANNFKIEFKTKSYSEKFEELIEILSQKEQVVILIDEYDKPIIDYLDYIEQAEKNRGILKNFYSILKSQDKNIKFLFITGVSKFSKVSIFSDLNHLQDITTSKIFSNMLGYTEKELIIYFSNHIDRLAKEFELNKNELLEKIKHYYNGYSWDGKNFVYNPFSILNLFAEREFKNYWFATGTPTFLVEYLRKLHTFPKDLETINVNDSFFNKFTLSNMDVYSLLFQTGYFTIKKKDEYNDYHLGYPNEEVRVSFLYNLLEAYSYNQLGPLSNSLINLRKSVLKKNLESFVSNIKSIFASIPYDIFIPDLEAYYHSILYIVFRLLGVYINCEVHTNHGRVDAVIEIDSHIYIIEFKMESAEDAMKQIHEKKYYEKYVGINKEVVLIGIAFGEKERNLKDWKVELMNDKKDS